MTAIANFSRSTENLESEIVSRAAISKTLTSAAIVVVARPSSRLLLFACASSVSGETSSPTPIPIAVSRDFPAIPPLSVGVETALLLSGVVTASLPSGVKTASLPFCVKTASLPSGVKTALLPSCVKIASLPSGVKTAPPPSGVGTAAPLSRVYTAALPFVVKTAALLSGVETAALPSAVDTKSEYAARQPSSAPPSIRVQTPSAAEIFAVSEARSTTVAEPESPRTLLRSAACNSVVAVNTRTRARTRTRTCTCTSTCTCTRSRTLIRPSRARLRSRHDCCHATSTVFERHPTCRRARVLSDTVRVAVLKWLLPSTNAPLPIEPLGCDPDLVHELDQEAPSLLKFQLLPPQVLVTQPHSLSVHPTRIPRTFFPIDTSTQAGVQLLRDTQKSSTRIMTPFMPHRYRRSTLNRTKRFMIFKNQFRCRITPKSIFMMCRRISRWTCLFRCLI